MELSNPTQFSKNARVAISKSDRVTLEGVSYRLHLETEVGFVFLRDDDTQLAQQFSHEDMKRLSDANGIRVEHLKNVIDASAINVRKPRRS